MYDVHVREPWIAIVVGWALLGIVAIWAWGAGASFAAGFSTGAFIMFTIMIMFTWVAAAQRICQPIEEEKI